MSIFALSEIEVWKILFDCQPLAAKLHNEGLNVELTADDKGLLAQFHRVVLSDWLDGTYSGYKYNYYDAGLTDKNIRNLRIVSAREAAEWKHRSEKIE